MKKKYDLAVKTGEYNGKSTWKNIGFIGEGEKGLYMLLDKTFNPAGVESKTGMIMVSMFQPKPKATEHQNFPEDAFGDRGRDFDGRDDIPF